MTPQRSVGSSQGAHGLYVCWRFERNVLLGLVANLGSDERAQIQLPAGAIIFSQGAKADEATRTMTLHPWAVAWSLSRPNC